MYKSKTTDIINWKRHAEQAIKFEDGIYEYSKINNISKSALYRWIKIYSDQGDLKKSKKTKKYNLQKESSFLPVSIGPSKLPTQCYTQEQLLKPDSRWVAEIITNVIRGLM